MRIFLGIFFGAILGLTAGYIYGFIALYALYTLPLVGIFLENITIFMRIILIPLGAWLGYRIMKRLSKKELHI